ncbi:MAG TPA: ABC transporter permease [Vicinamibacteria bacterium]
MAFERLQRLLRPPAEREVDDELEFHLEMRARELVAGGMEPKAARLQAQRRFRDLEGTKRECRRLAVGRAHDESRREWWGELRQDLGFALRQMAKAPGFTAVAVFTLALGIGAATAVFSVFRAVVLNPLPFPEADRIHVVALTSRRYAGGSASAGNYLYVAERQRSFGSLAAVDYRRFNLAFDDAPERVLGAAVSASFFEVFGGSAAHGRVFTAHEDTPGPDKVAVLSHGLWTRRFGGDPGVVGRSVSVSGVPREVIGVMPAGFDSTEGEELWVPIAFTPERRAMYDEHYLMLFGRLRPGVTPGQAKVDLATAAHDLARDHPRENEGRGATSFPILEEVVGDYRQRLGVLLGAVGLVLLIACANVANLFLGRGAARERELAVRAAVGAGRGRLARQLLTESLGLGLLAALLGVVVAEGGRRLLLATAPPGVPRLEAARIDPLVLGFAVALGLLASVLFGLAPALQAARVDLRAGLAEGGRGSTLGRDRMRRVLVAVEVGLALTLLVGAGLLVRTGANLSRASLGFDPEGVLTARVGFPAEGYSGHEKPARAFEAVLERLRARSEVQGAALVSKLPLTPGRGTNGLIPEGRDFVARNAIDSDSQFVSPGYFETMRIPLRAGRFLSDQDRRGGPKVMVINEELAKLAFPGQDALGKRMACCEAGEGGPDTPSFKEVVGIVADVKPFSPGASPLPQFYLPLDQVPVAAWDWMGRTLAVVVRSSQAPAVLTPLLREAVRSVDPAVPVYDVRTMLERRDRTMAQERFGAALLSGLGFVGLVLAGVGIYGVVAFFVSQRTREMAVRLALGAKARDVVALVARQSLGPVVTGLALGALGAVAAGQALQKVLYGVGAIDPLTLLAVSVLLFAVALLASALPARRAARVDPARSLAAG